MEIHPKVTSAVSGATIAGAITTIAVWELSLHGINIPGQVSDAITTLFGASIALVAGYLTPSPTKETN